MVIIKESYVTYENKVEAPPQDGNGGYLDATATKWKNDSDNNMLQFFKMQLFRAALPGDLQKAVTQHNQNTITLDNMYQVATDTQRESGAKAIRPVAAINEDSHLEAEEDEDKIAAFQKEYKYDLGLANDFKHKIYLKMQDSVCWKQFKMSEAHHQFIKQTLDELLKLGVVKRSN